MKEHSKYPFRSARLSKPECSIVANNRFDIILERGTYRLQAITSLSSDGLNNPVVFFAVTHRTALEVFPVGTTWATARGEILPVLINYHNTTPGFMTMASGYPVEVDVLDGQHIAAFDASNLVSIKYVKVADLPVEDPEMEGRRRA